MLRLEYIPLSNATLWDRNPKKHDLQLIAESIERYGFQDPPKYDEALAGLVSGNGRTQAIALIKAAGKKPPKGIAVNKETGEWAIPVIFGNDFKSKSVAEAYAIDHNNLTLANMDASQIMQIWDADGYVSLLEGLADLDGLPVTVNKNDFATLMEEIIEEDGGFGQGGSNFDNQVFEITVQCKSIDDMRTKLSQLIELGFDAIIK